MPSTHRKSAAKKPVPESPVFPPEALDQLLEGHRTPEAFFGTNGLLDQLSKALLERALQGEMTHHLGYEKHDPAGHNSGNSRNGTSAKTVKGKRGQVQLKVPRDRNSEFEPQLIPKGQTRLDGFDERVLSLYARGLSTREIQAHLEEIYGTQVSPDLISTVTDAVLDEVRTWQVRPLDALYPIVYLDALQVKIKSDGRVANKAIYLAVGINLHGHKEVLGLWAAQNEGAKFWLGVVTELKNRGVQRREMVLALRRETVKRLRTDVPLLGNLDEYWQSDHALDALVASLTARAAAQGRTALPTEGQSVLAQQEGWIHLPNNTSIAACLVNDV